jgi:hypothetical protein
LVLNVNNNVRGSPTLGTRPQLHIYRNDNASQLLLGVARLVQRPAAQIRVFSAGREVHCTGHHNSSKTLAELQIKNGDAVLVYIRMRIPPPDAEEAQEGETTTEEENDAKAEEEELRAAMLAIQQLPHQTLSSTEDYRELLFELVDRDRCVSSAMQWQAWQILLQLPTNPQLSQDLQDMKPGWPQLLLSGSGSGRSWSSRLYVLQTVQSLLRSKDEQVEGEGAAAVEEGARNAAATNGPAAAQLWLSRFLAQEGIEMLYQCFADTAEAGGSETLGSINGGSSTAAVPPLPPGGSGAAGAEMGLGGGEGGYTNTNSSGNQISDQDTFTEGQRVSSITLLLQLLHLLVVSAVKTTAPRLCVDPRPQLTATSLAATGGEGPETRVVKGADETAAVADDSVLVMTTAEAILLLQKLEPCKCQLQQHLFVVLDGLTGDRGGGGATLGAKEVMAAVEGAGRLWVALCIYWPSLLQVQLRRSSSTQEVLLRMLLMPEHKEGAAMIRKCVSSSLHHVCTYDARAEAVTGGGGAAEAEAGAGEASATSSSSGRLFVLQMLLQRMPSAELGEALVQAQAQASKEYFELVARLLADMLRAEQVAPSQAEELVEAEKQLGNGASVEKNGKGEGEEEGAASAISESGCDRFQLVGQLVAKLKGAPVVETVESASTVLQGTLKLLLVALSPHSPASAVTSTSTQVDSETTPPLDVEVVHDQRLLIFAGASVAQGGGKGCGLVRELFCRCLFAPSCTKPATAASESVQIRWREERAQLLASPPLCKSESSRALSLELLGVLCGRCECNARELVTLLDPMVVQQGQRELDWGCDPSSARKSSAGFAGIQNPGCICYMNSLLQQLFMMPTLRYGLLAAVVTPPPKELGEGVSEGKGGHKEEDDMKNVVTETTKDSEGGRSEMLYQLQRLLGCLLLTEKQAADPLAWCRSYKGEGGVPVNVRVQQDANEFLTHFCDRVEEEMGKTCKAQAGLVRDCLEVRLCSQLLCYKQVVDEQGRGGRKLLQSREKPEGTPYISLDVRNISNGLLGSLEFFFQEETLNDFKWEKPEGTAEKGEEEDAGDLTTIKRYCIEQLPDTVLLHLKRFELDYETFLRVKVNDEFEFPYELDLFPYTKEGRAFTEEAGTPNSGDKQAKAASNGEVEEEEGGRGDTGQPEPQQPKYVLHPREYYDYKLVGCVVHTGTVDSGHYYSFIKERGSCGSGSGGVGDKEQGGRWLEFNDETIRERDLSDTQVLKDECFGGHRSSMEYNQFLSKHVERKVTTHKSAFMLVYERDVKFGGASSDGKCGDNEGGGKVATVSSLNTGLQRESGGHMIVNEDVPSEVYDAVMADNAQWVHSTHLFSASFANFMLVLTTDTRPAPVLSYTPAAHDERGIVSASIDFETRLLLMLAKYMVEVLAHSSHAHLFADVAAALATKFKQNVPACVQLLEQYTHTARVQWDQGKQSSGSDDDDDETNSTSSLAETLLYCPLQHVRQAFARFMLDVLSTVTQHEELFLSQTEPDLTMVSSLSTEGRKDEDEDEDEDEEGGVGPMRGRRYRAVSSRFLAVCMCSLEAMEDAAHSWRTFGEYQWLLLQWAEQGRRQRCFLVQQQMVMRVVDMVLGGQSPVTSVEVGFPLGNTRKRPSPMAHMAGRLVAPDWSHPLVLLSLLIRSCPTQIADSEELSFPQTMLETVTGQLGLGSEWTVLGRLSQKCILTKIL